jgi:hypothetical protein
MESELARFVGRVASMEKALGCNARLVSRFAARLCAAAPHWEARVQMDALAIREMRFMRDARESAIFKWSDDHSTARRNALRCLFGCQ